MSGDLRNLSLLYADGEHLWNMLHITENSKGADTLQRDTTGHLNYIATVLYVI